MTQDEILSAAKEAGCNDEFIKMAPCWLESFAKIIERKTIERCAAMWNNYMETCRKHGQEPEVESVRDFCSAAAIRKLGEE